ncbi:MAG: glutathione S-transferase N-terminal domain-containing protein, partial [Gammaproteobacteria bacterium]
MTLYTYFRSSAAYRVRIALHLKGLAYEPRYVHLLQDGGREPDYREINPQGFVPVLVADGLVLTQSLAIIEYLDEVCPEPPLLPAGAQDRAYVRALAQLIACDVHPLNNLR